MATVQTMTATERKIAAEQRKAWLAQRRTEAAALKKARDLNTAEIAEAREHAEQRLADAEEAARLLDDARRAWGAADAAVGGLTIHRDTAVSQAECALRRSAPGCIREFQRWIENECDRVRGEGGPGAKARLAALTEARRTVEGWTYESADESALRERFAGIVDALPDDLPEGR